MGERRRREGRGADSEIGYSGRCFLRRDGLYNCLVLRVCVRCDAHMNEDAGGHWSIYLAHP